MKKQPRRALGLVDVVDVDVDVDAGGASGSMPTKGEATRVPIRRRLSLLALLGSATVVTSASGVWVDVEVEEDERRAQWTTLKGHRSSATSDEELGSKSVRVSWRIGGGSITRRSRSPKPQARAAIGC